MADGWVYDLGCQKVSDAAKLNIKIEIYPLPFKHPGEISSRVETYSDPLKKSWLFVYVFVI